MRLFKAQKPKKLILQLLPNLACESCVALESEPVKAVWLLIQSHCFCRSLGVGPSRQKAAEMTRKLII